MKKAFIVLKKKANSAKGHKEKINIYLSVKEGLKIISSQAKGGSGILLDAAVGKIASFNIDAKCNRTFGIVSSLADLKYQFLAVKLEKSAQNLKLAFDNLVSVTSQIVASSSAQPPVTGTLQLQTERAIDVPPG